MVRWYSLLALETLQAESDRLVPLLNQALQDENRRVRRAAVKILGRQTFSLELADVMLIQALANEDSIVRQLAADILAGYGKEAEPLILKRLVNTSDPLVREAAEYALERLRKLAP